VGYWEDHWETSNFLKVFILQKSVVIYEYEIINYVMLKLLYSLQLTFTAETQPNKYRLNELS